MDPRTSGDDVDDGADHERQQVQVQALPQGSTIPLQLLAAGRDLLAELGSQGQHGSKGRQDGGQDDRDDRRPDDGVGQTGRGKRRAEEGEPDGRAECDSERGSDQRCQDRRVHEQGPQLPMSRSAGPQQRGVATSRIRRRVSGKSG